MNIWLRSDQFARALIAAAVTRRCIQAGGNQLLVVERVMNGSEEERAQTPSSYLPSVALNALPVCVPVIDYLIAPSLPSSLLLLCCFASFPLLRWKCCEHQVLD